MPGHAAAAAGRLVQRRVRFLAARGPLAHVAAAAGGLIPTLIILTFLLYVGWLQHQTLTAIMGLAALYLLRLLLGCTVFTVPLTFNLGITAGLICLVVGFLGHRGLTAIDET